MTIVRSNPFAISIVTSSAEADWQARIAGPGVVWYHDFRSAAEVDAFRWTNGVGNDPSPESAAAQRCRWIDTDGITGGCLEIMRAAGTVDTASWWRPFSPLVGGSPGNGRDGDDPGAGRIAPRPWNPANRNELANHRFGYYMNPEYFDAYPDEHDGFGWYLQMRVKIDPMRTAPGQPPGGKTTFFTRNDRSLTSQAIVVESFQPGAEQGVNYFSMYRSGSPPLEADTPDEGSQPGNDDGFCSFSTAPRTCWRWSGGWDTLLFRVVPGLGGGDVADPSTVIEVLAAHPGERTYTKIWDQQTAALPFDVVWGHNALLCSGYENAQEFAVDAYKRWAQIIFSTELIPCPQD